MKVLIVDDTVINNTTTTDTRTDSGSAYFESVEIVPAMPEKDAVIMRDEAVKHCQEGWRKHVSKIRIISKGLNLIRSINGQGWRKLFLLI